MIFHSGMPPPAVQSLANGPANDISVADLATNTVTRKIAAGKEPWGVVYCRGNLLAVFRLK